MLTRPPSHSVAVILALMSVASWYLILAKAWDWYNMRRAARAVGAFWGARSVAEGLDRLREAGEDSPYAQLAAQAARRACGPERSPPPAERAAGAAATDRGNSGTTWTSGVRAAQLTSPGVSVRMNRRTIPAAQPG